MTDAKYWADNYHRLQKQRARSQPKPRQETGPPQFEVHPLLLRHDNVAHELEARRVIAEQQEQARREAERRSGPHPLVVGALSRIPIPERPPQKRKGT
jgi:hypothetical protein